MSWGGRAFRIGLGIGAATAIASAQTPSPKTKETAPKETVTVKAARPTVQVLPDRVVYSLDKNIQSSTGSLSDVLRNLPSVNVDIDGNVTVRGDSNVTVLIDGKKSPLLAGNLADALQQIPAEMVERIEVITNPSAEFRAEGSGGIINIVLKKDKEQRASGVARVNIGNEGRINASVSGKIKLGRVNLNGGYGERRDGRRSLSSTVRSDGSTVRSFQDDASRSKFSGRYAWLSASFNSNNHNEFEFGGNYNRFGGSGTSHEHNVAAVDASDILRDGQARWYQSGVGAELGYTHKFDDKGRNLVFELSHYSFWGNYHNDFTSLLMATGAADYWQSRQTLSHLTHTEFKADYTLPLPDHGQFKTGYQLQNDTNLSNDYGLFRDPTMTGWSPDNSFINYFVLDRTIHAGYVSYERKFGRFGVMSGLRLEQDFLHTDLKTTGETHDTSTLGFYPSAHLSYDLTDTQQVGLSYSRRMNRPGTYALNPARYSNDAFNTWTGNPYLKPEQVDSFEASYRDTGEKFQFVATGYYRATYKGITNVYRYVSDTVLLTTMDNLARRLATGVEADLNATLLSGLTLRTTATLDYNEFNPGAQGLGEKQSGMSWNIKGGIDWQATPDDMVQFNAQYFSKQRFAQGYSDPSLSGDLGFRHKFDGGFAAVLSLNNLFNSWGRNVVLDSPGVHQVSHNARLGRVIYFGLVYTFGGAKDTQQITSGNEGGGGNVANPGGQ